jgi:hypothetical protein
LVKAKSVRSVEVDGGRLRIGDDRNARRIVVHSPHTSPSFTAQSVRNGRLRRQGSF